MMTTALFPLVALALVAAPVAAALTVTGVGAAPVEFGAAELAALPRQGVDWTVHGTVLHCEGPWLADVLAKAGAPSGEALRGAALATVVVATGADGYRVAFGLGELDHALGDARVIVADRCDGAPLPDADGPLRLVAAGDTRGARSVRQLVRLSVAAVP